MLGKKSNPKNSPEKIAVTANLELIFLLKTQKKHLRANRFMSGFGKKELIHLIK